MADITFKITAKTDVGRVRSNNEDNFIVCPDLNIKDNWFSSGDNTLTLGNTGALLVVADGMGGMNAGEVASAIAIDTIKEEFSQADLNDIVVDDTRIEEFMKDVVVKADAKIKERAAADPQTEGMGTTVVIGWVVGNKIHVRWCGDSRAYLFNNSGLRRISKDHSLVQQLIDEETELNKNDYLQYSNIITRSLGDSEQIAEADYRSQRLSAGDTILLCSDGLCGLCDDDKIYEIMSRDTNNIDELRDNLINAALNAGGDDNVTIALFQVIDAPKWKTFGKETCQIDIPSKGDNLRITEEVVEEKTPCSKVSIISKLKCIGAALFKSNKTDNRAQQEQSSESSATEVPHDIEAEEVDTTSVDTHATSEGDNTAEEIANTQEQSDSTTASESDAIPNL